MIPCEREGEREGGRRGEKEGERREKGGEGGGREGEEERGKRKGRCWMSYEAKIKSENWQSPLIKPRCRLVFYQ